MIRRPPRSTLFPYRRSSDLITAIDGSIGHFKTTISSGHGVETVEHGVVIVATGAGQYQPKEYGYGNGCPEVITQLDLESRLSDPAQGGISGTVVMRSEEHT